RRRRRPTQPATPPAPLEPPELPEPPARDVMVTAASPAWLQVPRWRQRRHRAGGQPRRYAQVERWARPPGRRPRLTPPSEVLWVATLRAAAREPVERRPR